MNRWLLGLLVLSLAACAAWSQAPEGELLYKGYCAACHDQPLLTRAPGRPLLEKIPPEAIVRALTSGSMAAMGDSLSAAQRQTLGKFLSKTPSRPKLPMSGACTAAEAKLPALDSRPLWNGWGVNAQNTRFQPDKMAGLAAAAVPKLKLKWAFGFPDDISAYAQPTVAMGRVFVGSAGGTVYSLDAKTGCVRWSYGGLAGVRTAITVAPVGGRLAAFFGDLQANLYALDAADGKLIWKRRLDTHPAARITGAPQLHNGRLYVPVTSREEWFAASPFYECCSFRGSVAAVDAASGEVIWQTYTIADAAQVTGKNKFNKPAWAPAGVGVWSSPTIDEKAGVLYAVTGDNYVKPTTPLSDSLLALDLATGKITWSHQFTADDAYNVSCLMPDHANCPAGTGPDFDFGASPILVNLKGGKRALLLGQKAGIVYAVDPDYQGAPLWQARVGKGGILGGIQWGMAADGQHVYAAVSDLSASIKSLADYSVDPKAGGGLAALNLETGEKAWFAPPVLACGDRLHCSPAQSAAVTAIPGVVFSGSDDGHLRAYAAGTGKILWDVDTVRDYTTVNGITARGGSLDGPGPVIVGGMLFVNSGYGSVDLLRGNVLLAFSVDGK